MRNNWLIFIIGEWWTSLVPAEKSKFNNLASEYKEHLMREQPNFSYNKKQQQQVPINQSVNKSQLATNSVKPKGEGTGSVVNTPSYDISNEKFVEKHGSQIHLVQLQQRSGNEAVSQKIPVSSSLILLLLNHVFVYFYVLLSIIPNNQ